MPIFKDTIKDQPWDRAGRGHRDLACVRALRQKYTLGMTECGAPSPAVGLAYVIKNPGRELRYDFGTCTFDLTKLTGLLPMIQCQMPGSYWAISLRF
jgi:hypothetical protein